MAGNICHVEISVRDMAAARKFYGDLFGWTFPMESEEYTVFQAGEGVGGGLCLDKKRKADGAVRIYIHVASIPRMLRRIASAGGKVVRTKTRIGGGYGCMATFRDPSGNLMCLWAKD